MLRTALVALASLLSACAAANPTAPTAPTVTADHAFPEQRTEAEWRAALSPEQYRILRERGTERAWTGPYVDNHEDGAYRCAGCGQVLFDSAQKFESGSGWPSFWQPAADGAVAIKADLSHGMVRTEVVCARCGGHLGHVFNDGPRPTGERWCINGHALSFEARPVTQATPAR